MKCVHGSTLKALCQQRLLRARAKLIAHFFFRLLRSFRKQLASSYRASS
jgi:hypothetical protein